MGRNRAAGGLDGLQRAPTNEEQQDAAPGDIISAHPTVGMEDGQAHDGLVESRRTIEIVDIEHGFEDGGQGGHGVMLRGAVRRINQPGANASRRPTAWQVLTGVDDVTAPRRH